MAALLVDAARNRKCAPAVRLTTPR
jgi:hypothetical protein